MPRRSSRKLPNNEDKNTADEEDIDNVKNTPTNSRGRRDRQNESISEVSNKTPNKKNSKAETPEEKETTEKVTRRTSRRSNENKVLEVEQASPVTTTRRRGRSKVTNVEEKSEDKGDIQDTSPSFTTRKRGRNKIDIEAEEDFDVKANIDEASPSITTNRRGRRRLINQIEEEENLKDIEDNEDTTVDVGVSIATSRRGRKEIDIEEKLNDDANKSKAEIEDVSPSYTMKRASRKRGDQIKDDENCDNKKELEDTLPIAKAKRRGRKGVCQVGEEEAVNNSKSSEIILETKLDSSPSKRNNINNEVSVESESVLITKNVTLENECPSLTVEPGEQLNEPSSKKYFEEFLDEGNSQVLKDEDGTEGKLPMDYITESLEEEKPDVNNSPKKELICSAVVNEKKMPREKNDLLENQIETNSEGELKISPRRCLRGTGLVLKEENSYQEENLSLDDKKRKLPNIKEVDNFNFKEKETELLDECVKPKEKEEGSKHSVSAENEYSVTKTTKENSTKEQVLSVSSESEEAQETAEFSLRDAKRNKFQQISRVNDDESVTSGVENQNSTDKDEQNNEVSKIVESNEMVVESSEQIKEATEKKEYTSREDITKNIDQSILVDGDEAEQNKTVTNILPNSLLPNSKNTLPVINKIVPNDPDALIIMEENEDYLSLFDQEESNLDCTKGNKNKEINISIDESDSDKLKESPLEEEKCVKEISEKENTEEKSKMNTNTEEKNDKIGKISLRKEFQTGIIVEFDVRKVSPESSEDKTADISSKALPKRWDVKVKGEIGNSASIKENNENLSEVEIAQNFIEGDKVSTTNRNAGENTTVLEIPKRNQSQMSNFIKVKNNASANFQTIILIASSDYAPILRRFETAYIKLILDDDLNMERVVHLVNQNKNISKNALWILMSGVFTVVEHNIHSECFKCNDEPLIKITPSSSFAKDQVSSTIQYILNAVNKMCMDIQQILGPDGIIVLCPPIPAVVVEEECFKHHTQIHERAVVNKALVASREDLVCIKESFNIFCEKWTDLACHRMHYWFQNSEFQNYQKKNSGKNIATVINKDSFATVLNSWSDSMRVFMNLVLLLPYPNRIMINPLKCSNIPKVDNNSKWFNQVVIIGSTSVTKTLQSMTKDLPVEWVDDNVDFDDDGIALLQKLQEKWPNKTLWIVVTGISEIAEPCANGPPACVENACVEPLPAFVNKHHELGDKDFKGMSTENVAQMITNQAFDFATKIPDYLGPESAMFLTPIIPLAAVWAGKSSSLSHASLHKMHKQNPLIPFFMGTADVWIESAKMLESKWLKKMMEFIPADSQPGKLIRKYVEEKEPVLQYVYEADKLYSREIWSKLMLDIIKQFLDIKENNDTDEVIDITASPERPSFVENNNNASIEKVKTSRIQASVKNTTTVVAPVNETKLSTLVTTSSNSNSSTTSATFVKSDEIKVCQTPSQPKVPSTIPPVQSKVLGVGRHIAVVESRRLQNKQVGTVQIPVSQDSRTTTSTNTSNSTEKATYTSAVLQPSTIVSVSQSTNSTLNVTGSKNLTFSNSEAHPPGDPFYEPEPCPSFGQPPPFFGSGFPSPALPHGSMPPPGPYFDGFHGPMPPYGPHGPMPPHGPHGPMPPHGSHGPMPPHGLHGPMPPHGPAGPFYDGYCGPIPFTGPGMIGPSPTANYYGGPILNQNYPQGDAATMQSGSTSSDSSVYTIQAPPKLNNQVNQPIKGSVILQNIKTTLKEDQFRQLLHVFGNLESFKWPKADNKGLKFIMVTFQNKENAKKAITILNYMKIFGELAKIQLIGAQKDNDNFQYYGEDSGLLLTIREYIDKCTAANKMELENLRPSNISKSSTVSYSNTVTSSVPLPYVHSVAYNKPVKFDLKSSEKKTSHSEKSSTKSKKKLNCVTVSNFTELAPRDSINKLFVELGALQDGVYNEGSLIFTFQGRLADLTLLKKFRFPDKKLMITFNAGNAADVLSPSEIPSAKVKVNYAVGKVLDDICRTLKQETDNEMNIYTFKTRPCKYGKKCRVPMTCLDYHDKVDRRRCPVLYTYSDEDCPSMKSFQHCNLDDRCPKSHSAIEKLFSFKIYRSKICSGYAKNGICGKSGRVCASVHPGKPDMFYHEHWDNLYVEGLKRTLTFFKDAIRNLFLFNKLPCARVLLITPSEEMVHLYAKCVSDLVEACHQTLRRITGKEDHLGNETVIIATEKSILRFLPSKDYKFAKGPKIELQRLKAVIIDDGPLVFENLMKINKLSYLREFSRHLGMNIVITAEQINKKDIEDLRSEIWFKGSEVYLDESLNDIKSIEPGIDPKNTSREDVPPSSSKQWAKSSSKSDHYSNYKDKSFKEKKKYDYDGYSSHKEKSYSKEEKKSKRSKYDNDDDYEDKYSNLGQKKYDTFSLSKYSKHEKPKMDYEEKDSRSNVLEDDKSKVKHYKITEAERRLIERESRLSLTDERSNSRKGSPCESDTNTDRLTNLKKRILEGEEDLKNEMERELKLYIEMPEIHPSYESKFSIFMEQYRKEFPGFHNLEHSDKLWKEFWKELVTVSLKEEYKMKKKALEIEIMGTFKEEETSKTHLKRKSSYDEDYEIPEKYSRRERSVEKPSSSYKYSHNEGSSDRQTSSHKYTSYKEGTKDMSSSKSMSLEESICLLEDLCPVIGILEPALKLLLQRLRANLYNKEEAKKILLDSDNDMLLKMVSDKLKAKSERVESDTFARKLKMGSVQVLKLMNFTIDNEPPKKEKFLGLDMVVVARATYNKDPPYILKYIKESLQRNGVNNATKDDITEIYEALAAAHFDMAYD